MKRRVFVKSLMISLLVISGLFSASLFVQARPNSGEADWYRLSDCLQFECRGSVLSKAGARTTKKVADKIQACEAKEGKTAEYQKCRQALTHEFQNGLRQRWADHYTISLWAAANYRFLGNRALANKYEKMGSTHEAANMAYIAVGNSELCTNQVEVGLHDRRECPYQQNLARLKVYATAGPEYSQYVKFAQQDANIYKGSGFWRAVDTGGEVLGAMSQAQTTTPPAGTGGSVSPAGEVPAASQQQQQAQAAQQQADQQESSSAGNAQKASSNQSNLDTDATQCVSVEYDRSNGAGGRANLVNGCDFPVAVAWCSRGGDFDCGAPKRYEFAKVMGYTNNGGVQKPRSKEMISSSGNSYGGGIVLCACRAEHASTETILTSINPPQGICWHGR